MTQQMKRCTIYKFRLYWQKMRQRKITQMLGKPARPSGRVTRGFSNLPKESESEQHASGSDSEQQLSSPPKKNKKIHHMTLKAIERRKKQAELAERAAAEGLRIEDLQQLIPKAIRRRGRPRGSKKKAEDKEDFDVDNSEVSESSEEVGQGANKPLALRKRTKAPPKIIEDSAQIEQQIQRQMEAKQKEIEEKRAKEAELVAAGPRRRGRKKKIQPEPEVMVPEPQAIVESMLPAKKKFTIPKQQTYDNYNKYYHDLIKEAKKEQQDEVPLIFDKFSDPEGYKRLVTKLKQ